jgi:antitoxin component of MazEF toxin-antitoxin module
MALVKRFTRVGNSASMIFDQPVLKQVGWEIGTQVEIKVSGENIILSPHRSATDDEAQAAGDRVIGRRRQLIERLAKR